MITLEVRQSVADFDRWKLAFDGNADSRKSHGATKDRVFRDGNDVLDREIRLLSEVEGESF
jgi:hypothetical protein